MHYSILKHIAICDNRITIDGELDFQGSDGEPFRSFAKSVYKNYAIDYSKFYKMDKLSKLGFLATELLLANIGLENYADDEVALVLANASSSLNNDADYQKTINGVPSPAVFVYTLPNIVIGEICIRYGFKGEGTFFIQQEFDADFTHRYASSLLADGTTKLCIAGWAEMGMDDAYNANFFLVGSGYGVKPFTSLAMQELFVK